MGNINNLDISVPASFRVIGVGSGVAKTIDKVKSFGFDGLSAEVVDSPAEIAPSASDRMAIIVSTDQEDTANRIASSFHQAGVLTLGLSEAADPSCYDSILEGATPAEYPDAIKALLQTILKPCYINFDFNDLKNVLQDSRHFSIRKVTARSLTSAVERMQEELKNMDLGKIKNLTLNIFLNREGNRSIDMNDMRGFSEMLTKFTAKHNVLWSVHFDDELEDNQIGLISLLSA